MKEKRYVMLDPDGTQPDWLVVVVRSGTGVVYEQQYGGTTNRQGGVEGYLVPVGARDPARGRHGLRELRDLFERELRGAGRPWSAGWPPDLYHRLASAVGSVHFWTSSPVPAGELARVPLAVDEERLHELDEAWVPVRTRTARVSFSGPTPTDPGDVLARPRSSKDLRGDKGLPR